MESMHVTMYILAGFFVVGNAIQPLEADSSPSHILSTKGSSVQLHWSYNYDGDTINAYGHFPMKIVVVRGFKKQTIGLKVTPHSAFQALAKRYGQVRTFTLEPSMPATFKGRVEVISSNSTLIIHNLQYNDSTYQFSSNIEIGVSMFRHTIPHIRSYKTTTELKPSIRITVVDMYCITFSFFCRFFQCSEILDI